MGQKSVKHGAKKNSRKEQMALAHKRTISQDNAEGNKNDSCIDSTTTNSIVDSDTDIDATIYSLRTTLVIMMTI